MRRNNDKQNVENINNRNERYEKELMSGEKALCAAQMYICRAVQDVRHVKNT